LPVKSTKMVKQCSIPLLNKWKVKYFGHDLQLAFKISNLARISSA